MSLTHEIRQTILTALPGADVVVTDPMDDGQHFQAVVVAPQFEGLSRVKQHQLVMRPLTQAFATSVHALSLKTMSPSEWSTQ
ncbi:BolA/IbaG family iron-sulfur metabolism protein [bacterium]|nr:BolA/IbaG family iron-sulfur metabolism protein [bacterium]